MTAPGVTVWAVEWCPHCVAVRQFLRREQIEHAWHDVDVDNAQWQVMLRLTGGIDLVPVVQIGTEVRYGRFDAAFESWIGARTRAIRS